MERHTNVIDFSKLSGSVTLTRWAVFDPHVLLCSLCLSKTSLHHYLWMPLREVLVWWNISFDHRSTQKALFFFLNMCPNLPHVIRGIDRLSGAFLCICAEFQRAPALLRILNGVLAYARSLPWLSVTGSICLYLMEITKGLSGKIGGNMSNGKISSMSR